MSMRAIYEKLGAQLAPDGIPLHFGDSDREYEAALNAAILLDRSHEGRIALAGADRFELLNRMSTNDLLHMASSQAVPTIFTNANARVLDRVVAFNESDESLLLLAGPGRGDAFLRYLQRNIFFNDDARPSDLGQTTHQFALHGPKAGQVIDDIIPGAVDVLYGKAGDVDGIPVTCVRLKPFVGEHWVVITPEDSAAVVWQALMSASGAYDLMPAGGLTYNTLRIRAGRPGVGFELTDQYIPLELGLWDEISFNKGCYTGQEIIARMESRERLARTLVRLNPEQSVQPGSDLLADGRSAGKVTSSVIAPDGTPFAMGVVKLALANAGETLRLADGTAVQVGERLGVQPAYLQSDQN